MVALAGLFLLGQQAIHYSIICFYDENRFGANQIICNLTVFES